MPLDIRLKLPATRFSYLLQDWNQQLCVENPFNQVSKVLDRILQFKQPVDSIERMAYQSAGSVEDFRLSHEKNSSRQLKSNQESLHQKIGHLKHENDAHVIERTHQAEQIEELQNNLKYFSGHALMT